MKIIGLTGSIGMGKSTTAKMLRNMGVPVHCADEAVHKAFTPGGAAVARIAKLYPAALKKRGAKKYIDRKILSHAAFHDKKLMKSLEKILHPLSRKSEREFLKRARKRSAKIVVLDIPLLFETGGERRVDEVWVVSAPLAVQKRRVMLRPGMTIKKFRAVLKRQMKDGKKRRRADVIIPTATLAGARRALKKALVEASS